MNSITFIAVNKYFNIIIVCNKYSSGIYYFIIEVLFFCH